MNAVQVFLLCVTCIALCSGLHTAGKERPIVETIVGTIKGIYKISEFKGRMFNVNRFLGIRYGQAPVEELRFQKPEPYGNFSEPLEATTFGTACPQVDMMGLGIRSKNEDCLFLNIFAPTAVSDQESGHAVIVYIHGGGFSFGSSSLIPGDIMASVGNVIVVTINYRLGFFGFMNTGDGQVPGNAGLWDQRLAIQWVKDNIVPFGGDPDRITLLGESTGSINALLHGMYPPNEGLFQNIVAVSGSATMPFGLKENNLDSVRYLARMVACHDEDYPVMMTCLKQTPIGMFMKKIKRASKDPEKWRWLNFAPTMDGVLIKRNPTDIIHESKTKLGDELKFLRSLGLLNGMNGGEGGLWIVHMAEDLETLEISRDDMVNTFIPNTLPIVTQQGNTPDVLIKLVAAEYTDWNNITDARRKYVKYMGDLNFNVPATLLSMAHANGSNADSWMYRFEAVLSKHLLPTPSWLKVANQGDIVAPLLGYPANYSCGNYRDQTDYQPLKWELRLSNRMMTYVGNFARNGDPNVDPEHPTWPKYDITSQTFISFKRNDSIGRFLYSREVNFWQEVVPAVSEAISKVQTVSADKDSSKPSSTVDIQDVPAETDASMVQSPADEHNDADVTVEVEPDHHEEL